MLRFFIVWGVALLAASCGGGGSEVITGEIRVAPELVSEIPRNPLLIIQARRAGAALKAGRDSAPVAEQRVRNPKFPLKYFLGPPDLTENAGGLSGPLVIFARIVGDELSGDTAKPIALEGRSDGEAQGGRRDVDIVIRKRVPVTLARAPRPGKTVPRAGAPGRPGAQASAVHKTLSGRVTVSPALGAPPQGGVLFIIVRPSGSASGPPLAVRRMSNTGFPVQYEVTGEDVMIPGMPFEGPVSVRVRLDRDGRVGVQPGDLEGRSKGPARVGDRGVDIVLDRRR